MAIYRCILVIGLLFLVRESGSAPTMSMSTTKNIVYKNSTSTTNSEESTTPSNVPSSTPSTTEGLVNESSVSWQNTTGGSLKNATVSSNVTNTTTVVDDGPSSILYPVCSNYLGIQSKKVIKDEQMFASSTLELFDLEKFINSTLEELDDDSNETSSSVKSNFTITGNMTAAHHGRLGSTEGSWCASGDLLEGEHHLTVDLGQVLILEGVITQGRSDSDNWVTEYTVSYSSTKKHWKQIEKDGELLVLKGNNDRNSMAVGSFPHRIAARYIKFTPKSFHGKLICMRVEAIGCHPDAVNVAKNQPVQLSDSERNSTSSNVVDGVFVPQRPNETCTHTRSQYAPWLRIDLRRIYHVKEVFISNQDSDNGWDMFDFEVRVGNSLDNEGNDNPKCTPAYTLLPGRLETIACKNETVGRYVNIRVNRGDQKLSLCEVAVIGIADTIVRLGLGDIASSLQTGSVKDNALGMAGDAVGGLLGQLGGQMGGQLGGMGMGMLNNLKGQGMGMLNNLGAQGMGMLNNLQGQGMAMANKLKNQGLAMANKMKDQAMGMANKMKDQAMEMADKAKKQAMEAAEKAKKQAMEAAEKMKKQGMEAADKAKEQGMEMANQLQGQSMEMVGDMQGQMNQQQDKFKKKLKEMLEKGQDYLKTGKEEMEKFKKKGYIETGKEYMDIGLGMMMDGVAFIQAKLMESISSIAGDMTKQITTLSEYDTSDIKGLLDDVDPVPVRNFVEEAKPKIGEFIEEMQKMAKKYLEIGIEKGKEAKNEIESEADSAKNQATGMGKNVAGKATAAGKNMANKAKDAGMAAVDKAKKAGLDAANKAKSAGMDAMNKAKDAGMKMANKAKEAGMGALDKAKGMGMAAVGDLKKAGMGALDQAKGLGMGALDQAKGLGMGAFDQLKQAGMGALAQAQGLAKGMLGQLSRAGMELLKKAKNMKPSQLKEMSQVQTLLQLKKMKQMKELEKKIELEQDGQWKRFEELNKEMGDEIELEKVKLEDEGDIFKDNDVPELDGSK